MDKEQELQEQLQEERKYYLGELDNILKVVNNLYKKIKADYEIDEGLEIYADMSETEIRQEIKEAKLKEAADKAKDTQMAQIFKTLSLDKQKEALDALKVTTRSHAEFKPENVLN